MKDGRTRLGYKPEHAVDLDTGAIGARQTRWEGSVNQDGTAVTLAS
jgi:hypothetical protein